MTVYGPDIEGALQTYANQFDDLTVAERTPIIDLNAINPLSQLREDWANATSEETEHRLDVTAGTDDTAYLETEERGQYPSGFEVQCGQGFRLPERPVNDEVVRWGYYIVDANGDPYNGFYYGVDSTGLFVGKALSGTIERVYQENWNKDVLDGSGKEDRNPSDGELGLDKGNIFQIEFTYYGYGPVEMQVALNDGIVTLHRFIQDGQTSIGNTNLPLRQEIVSNGTNSDALTAYVGGRQFSVIGKRTTNNRIGRHYRDTLAAVDDTQWYPAINIKIKDGTDIGNINFNHVLANIFEWSVINGNAAMRWQIRRDVTLDTVTWEDPEHVEGDSTETCMKVDTSATTIGDGNGFATGEFLGGGTIPSGGKQRTSIDKEGVDGRITNNDIITLAFRAQAGKSGDISAITFKWEEQW